MNKEELIQAYKVGFLTKLAEHGYTPQDIDKLLEDRTKQAQIPGTDFIGNAVKGIGNMALTTGGAVALGVPIGLGALTAYGRHALFDKTQTDIEDLQDSQILYALDNLTEQAKQRSQFLADLNKRKKVYTGRY